MPAQTQNKPENDSTFVSEEETAEASSPRTAKKKRRLPAIPLILSAFICIAALAGGRYLRTRSTLFLEKRSVDGYLPVEEYVLNETATGEPAQNVRGLKYERLYTFDPVSPMYESSRGIRPGDSWETFVDAYGDVTASSIYTYRYGADGKYDYDYESIDIYDPITIRSFHEQYVKTGIVDLQYDSISVYFRAETDGVKIYYTEEEIRNYHHKFYSTPHFLTQYDGLRSFELGFQFEPPVTTGNTENVLDYLTSDYS